MESLARPVTNAFAILGVFVQIALVAFVLQRLDILTSAFHVAAWLTGPLFIVNHLLPSAFRLKFFAVFSALMVVVALGGSAEAFWDPWLALSRAVPLFAVSAVLIGICLLPIGFWTRAAMLAAVGLVCGACRADLFGSDSLLAIWPVLAAFFMFRLFVFLYDVSAMPKRPGLAASIAYFFLYPNSVSTLFPIVDFRTMLRTYYNDDAIAIYKRGASWMMRGVIQLILFRFVRQLVTIDATQVSDGTDVALYIAGCTFVYLQVSGLFHLVVGMLLLFGFNLPVTNRRYFLASSFNDYWRRANIYWKDFILKVVYTPTYFRFKALGATRALVIATLWAFFVTWALHLYQTFWLKGDASIRSTDVIFWSALGILVLANSLWEMKFGRVRHLSPTKYDVRQGAVIMLCTAGTFATISLLWSLWSAPSLGVWLGIWKYADLSTLAWSVGGLGVVMAAKAVIEIMPTAAWLGALLEKTRPQAPALGRIAAQVACLVAAVIAVHPGAEGRLHQAVWQPWFDAIKTGDTMMDQLASRTRGYYETLTSADGANDQLWEMLTRRRQPERYSGPDPKVEIRDFRFHAALPNVDTTAYQTDFRTNSYGMRDQEYPLAKAARTVRIALLGSSHTMGWGVRKEAMFEEQLEALLNRRGIAGLQGLRFEVLNFAYNRLGPLAQPYVINEKVRMFHPDVVLAVLHSVDYEWVVYDLVQAVRLGHEITSPFLTGVIQASRITGRTHPDLAAKRVFERAEELLVWSYERIVEAIRSTGALPMAALVPVPTDIEIGPINEEQFAVRRNAAVTAGFPLLDLTHLYDGLTMNDVVMRDKFLHTNERGHAMIAEALYRQLAASEPFRKIASRIATEQPAPAPGRKKGG